jgi:hypothetical protein
MTRNLWAFALVLLFAAQQTVAAKDVTLPVGEVVIVNNYAGKITIHLRPADSPAKRFASYTIDAKTKRTRLTRAGKNLVLGGDWEMEVEFGSGVVSPRRVVAKVGTYKDKAWEVAASDIMDGLQRSAAKWAVPVLVIRYFPTTNRGRDLDLKVTEGPAAEGLLAKMKEKCTRMTTETARALEEGSRFRAYRHPYAPPSLRYEIVETIDVLEAVPHDARKKGYSDYHAILKRAKAKEYVEKRGVKEVWIWGYHSKTLAPWESNMSSPSGLDISNSDRDTRDLPIYNHTYTVYHYNYHRATEEAVHNHLHQIECLIRHADAGLARTFEGTKDRWRCGNCHFPPNAVKDYDYHNPRTVESDIEDWKPEGFGVKKRLNRDTWGDKELNWYVYWMRSIPGESNGLTYKKKPLTNWWHLVGDFDTAVKKRKGLAE